MALQTVPPPQEVWTTYRESLLDFFGPHPDDAGNFHLPVGALGLGDLAGGATLSQVRASGCRFIAQWTDGTLVSCEITDPTLYSEGRFRNFVSGEPVELPWARIGEAYQLDAVKSQDYELHLLTVPGIFFDGLHLVCRGQGDDLILPITSSHPDLATDAVLQGDDFLRRARSIAGERIAMNGADELSS